MKHFSTFFLAAALAVGCLCSCDKSLSEKRAEANTVGPESMYLDPVLLAKVFPAGVDAGAGTHSWTGRVFRATSA